MTVVKKINNNVAICRDGSQRELVAFGKGIGFPPTPYELTDLSKIDRTFYNVNSSYIPLLAEISPEIVRFTADQMLAIQDGLPYETSSNLVLTLADHIAFAIERAGRGIYVQISACADKICDCWQERWSVRLTVEEKLYLILHVNRVCSKERI